jgi:hypothetical protein
MTLAEALAQVHLEAGRTYDCEVNGQRVTVRVGIPSSAEPAARYDDSDVMIDPWTEFPVPVGVPIQVRPGAPLLPDAPCTSTDDE